MNDQYLVKIGKGFVEKDPRSMEGYFFKGHEKQSMPVMAGITLDLRDAARFGLKEEALAYAKKFGGKVQMISFHLEDVE